MLVRHKRDLLALAVIIVLGIFGLKAFFHNGFYTSLDGWHNVARIYHFDKMLREGQFPPRFSGELANGYGYPLFVYSYHAPWIMAEPFLLAGLDQFTVLKLVLMLGFVLSGVFFYFWLSPVLGRIAAACGAIIYLWTPYRFSKILVGASVGEATSFLFLPLFFWGLWNYPETGKKRYLVIGSLGLGGIILSHFILVPLLMPLVGLFLIFQMFTRRNRLLFWKRVSLIFLIGAGLSAYYLIPLVFYRGVSVSQSVNFGFASLYANHLVNLSQLIYSKWGFGPIVSSAKNGEQSLQVGIPEWLGFGGVIMLAVFLRRRLPARLYALALCCVIIFGLSVFLMVDQSRPVWDIIEKYVTIDYPWRHLAITTFVGSIMVGIVVSQMGKWKILIAAGLVVVALIFNRNHLNVNEYTNLPLSLYVASETTTNTFAEYMPVWVTFSIKEKGPIVGKVVSKNSRILDLEFNLPKSEIVDLNYIYFPGQEVFVNGRKSDFGYQKDGKIFLVVPRGESRVQVQYNQSTLMKLSNGLTLATLAALAVWGTTRALKKGQRKAVLFHRQRA